MPDSNTDLEFPIPAARLIPHRPPMQWVTQLESCTEDRVCASACLPADAIAADADGCLHESLLVELMAQTYAMRRGYENMADGRPPPEGYLIGISKAEFPAPARTDQNLSISVESIGSFGGFAVASGEIHAGDECLARASFKVYVPELDTPADSRES